MKAKQKAREPEKKSVVKYWHRSNEGNCALIEDIVTGIYFNRILWTTTSELWVYLLYAYFAWAFYVIRYWNPHIRLHWNVKHHNSHAKTRPNDHWSDECHIHLFLGKDFHFDAWWQSFRNEPKWFGSVWKGEEKSCSRCWKHRSAACRLRRALCKLLRVPVQLQAGGTHVKAPCGSESLISQLTRSVISLGHRRPLANPNPAADPICALCPPKINKGINPAALRVQSIDGAVSECEWRAGMLISLCSRFCSRLRVAWISGESDGGRGEGCGDREHTGSLETAGELLREALLTCWKPLLRVCTPNRPIYLNWTLLEEAGPANIEVCKHGWANQWEESEICFLSSLGCDFVRSGCTTTENSSLVNVAWMSPYCLF